MFNFNDPTHRADWELGSIDAQFASMYRYIKSTGTMEHDPERSHESWQMVLDECHQLFNTAMAFPILLGKRVNILAALKENCWMWRGETNIATLGCKVWDSWASKDGSIGHGYGEMMRRLQDAKILQVGNVAGRPNLTGVEYERQLNELERAKAAGYTIYNLAENLYAIEGYVDQLLECLEAIVNRSRSRRVKVQTYNPIWLPMQNLPPCHTDFTFNVTKATGFEHAMMQRSGREASSETLHISVQMRSSDSFLGRSFNVLAYSALHHLFATYAGLNIGKFTLNGVNTHIYEKHLPAVDKYLEQWDEIVEEAIEANEAPMYPILLIDPDIRKLSPKELLDTVNVDMFKLTDYTPAPAIKAEVTV